MKTKFSGILTLLLAFVVQITFAQEKTISGVVSDENGLPLPSATVVIKGTSSGTSTDFDGNYSITANQGDVLQFSFVGYSNKDVTIAADSSINVSLDPDNTLEEVVVTALGVKRKKEEVTSAYEVVKTEKLTQASNPNAVKALTGKVSGLQINQPSGGVNGTTRIVLRGNRSISGNNQALIVIDNAISSARVLGQIPPTLIESMTVLKGAQGAALYGSAGVNGAIIVTTKSGNSEGKTKVTISSAVDFQTIAFLPKSQQNYGQGWVTENNADFGDGNGNSFLVPFENGSWGPSYSDPRYAGKEYPVGLPQADGKFLYTKFAPIKDNIKDFFKTGLVSQQNVTIEQGGKDSNIALSVGNLYKDFIVEGDKFRRTNFLLKAGKKVGKFSINGRINYSNESTKATSAGLYGDLLQTPSNVPITRFANSGNDAHWTVYARSPYWKRKNQRSVNTNDYVNFSGSLNYEINDNISVSVRPNMQFRASNSYSYSNATNVFAKSYDQDFQNANFKWNGITAHTFGSLGGRDITSSYSNNLVSFTDFYNDTLINFNYDLNEDFTFGAILGNNIRDIRANIISHGGTNLEIPGWYHIKNVLNPSTPASLSNFKTTERRVATFANIDLGYKDYLFLNATGRYETSSTVNNSFFYPSVGLSFAPLKAIEGLKGNFLSEAKIYGNYLVVGNASAVGVGNVGTTPTSTPAGFPFNGTPSYVASAGGTNTNIKPEFVATKEIGGNFAFLKNRITLDASFYLQTTKDLITATTTSPTSGKTVSADNIGDLENRGYEIDLGLTPIKTENFEWTVKGSFATNRTVIKKLANGQKTRALLSSSSVSVVAEVGEQFPLIKGTTYKRDPNGNIIVDAATGIPEFNTEQTKIGKSTPDYILGLNTSVRYKGLRLGATMDYRTGHKFFASVKQTYAATGRLEETGNFDRNNGYVIPNSVVNTGTAANPVYTTNTRPLTTGAGQAGYTGLVNYYFSNYGNIGENIVIDATAFKLREVSLSYTLSDKIIKSTPFSAVTLGINARNIFQKFSSENQNFSDPEATTTTTANGNAQGVAQVANYPFTKSIGFNVNLTF